MQPLVSIILPTYNGAKFLRSSLDSCLAQTYTHFELIIVNDCSTDDTLAIAQAYQQKDSRIKIINNEVNKKLPRSLNAGFEAASGQYYTWTSDDNYYSPQALACMVDALTANPNIDLLYCNYTAINDAGDTLGPKILGNINQSFVQWEGCGACFLYKKEVHERNRGYDPTMFLIEDYDFFLRAYLHSSFKYLPRTDLYFYRLHAQSLTGTMAPAVFEIQKIAVEKKMPLLLPRLSPRDQMLLYRKYCVYYAVFKSNTARAGHYLQLLYGQSKWQAFLSIAFIAAKKAAHWFIVVPALGWRLLKLVLGIRS